MKAAVIGAGAVGMLTACLLKEAGSEVMLISRRAEQAQAINERGIIKGNTRIDVKASTDLEQIDPAACVLIAVKHDSVQDVVKSLADQGLENPIIFLQNGMLHVELAKQMPQQHIAAGSVEHGALKISDNEIRHTGKGLFKFALLKGDEKQFLPLADLEGFACEWHNDADRLLFRKVLLNSMINPLTALLSVKNGELLTNPHAHELLKKLYAELAEAFPETGTLLPFEEVTALCASTAQNTSSMLADKKAGRKLEVDTIVLYTLKRSPIELPTLRTLYLLLKSTEV